VKTCAKATEQSGTIKREGRRGGKTIARGRMGGGLRCHPGGLSPASSLLKHARLAPSVGAADCDRLHTLRVIDARRAAVYGLSSPASGGSRRASGHWPRQAQGPYKRVWCKGRGVQELRCARSRPPRARAGSRRASGLSKTGSMGDPQRRPVGQNGLRAWIGDLGWDA